MPKVRVLSLALLVCALIWLRLAPSDLSPPAPDLGDNAASLRQVSQTPRAAAASSSAGSPPGNSAASPVSPEQIAAAIARREHLLSLLDHDPARALAESIGFAEYAALPDALRPYYEEPFAALAALDVIPLCHGAPEAAGSSLLTLRHEGRTYSAVATGARVTASSRSERPLHGFLLGERALVADTPLAILTPADAARFTHLPLGQPDSSRDFSTGAPLGTEPVVALAGDRRLLFNDLAGATSFNERLAELDSRPGPRGGSALALALPYSADPSLGFDWAAAEAAVSTAASTWTETPKAVFFIRADFSDAPGTLSQASLANLLNTGAASSISQMSYGKTTINAAVSSTFIRLPQASSTYLDDSHLLYDHALARYRELHGAASLDAYDIIGVQFPSIGMGYAGLATIGGSRHWLQGNPSVTTIVHEFGHNYGIGHAHFWQTNDGSVVGSGTLIEYGDIFDIMGSGAAPEAHFHQQAKAALNWLEPARWADANTSGSGTYRLHRFDHAGTTGPLRGLRAVKDPSATPSQVGYYWVGYRAGIPDNAFLPHGAYVLWERPGSNNASLLDLTPGSAAGRADAALPLGFTYSDPAAGVHFTPLATGGSGADAWLDLRVELGSFPGNQAPSATFSPTLTVAARSSNQFTVVASDPDGDPLAYGWDFGDGSPALNSATRTHSWTVGGTYQVAVSVSDRKGGVTTRSATIQVTDPLLDWSASTVVASRTLRTVAHLRGRHLIGGNNHLYSSLDRATWTETPLGINYHANAFAADANAFVAVGRDYDFSISSWIGVIHRSLDGRLWQRVSLPTTVPELRSVAADGAGIMVAVGHGGTILRSADSGATWTSIPAPGASTPDLRSVARGGGLFMAVGARSVFTSPDGIVWTDRSDSVLLDSWHDFRAVHHHDGAWYAGGWYSGIHRSADGGQSWTRAAISGSADHTVEGIAAGGGVLLASVTRHQGGTNAATLLVSTAGHAWTAAPGAAPFPATSSLAYADGAFLSATGSDGQLRRSGAFFPGNLPPAAQSPRSVAQTDARQLLAFHGIATDGDGDALRHLWDFGDGSAYKEGAAVSHTFNAGGVFTVKLHVSDGRGGLVTTQRAITVAEPLAAWTQRGSGTTADLFGVARAPSGRLVAIGAGSGGTGGGTYRVSDDHGATWTAGGAVGQNVYFEDIHHAAGLFVAVGFDYDFAAPAGWRGIIHTSPDGLAWTRRLFTGAPLRGIAYGGGVFVAVGADGVIRRSTDAITWTTSSSGTANDLNSVAYGDGIFLAAGAAPNLTAGTVLTSPDGLTWTNRSAGLGTGQGLTAAAYLGDRFLVSGFFARIRHSTDGGQSFTTTLTTNPRAAGFARINGLYLAVGRDQDNGNVAQNLVSFDGARWTALTTPAFAERRAVIAVGDTFLTVGNGGQIWQSAPVPASPRGFDNWQAARFAGQPAALALPHADADGDGASNLAEYLAGTDPLSPAQRPSLLAEMLAGELTLTVPRGPGAGDVRVRFETSTDLSTWTEAGVIIVDTPEESVGSVPLGSPRRFLRARLELAE